MIANASRAASAQVASAKPAGESEQIPLKDGDREIDSPLSRCYAVFVSSPEASAMS